MHGKKGTLFLYREHPIISPLSVSHHIAIVHTISVSEVHKKTGAEVVSSGIMRRNLGTKQKVPSPNSVRQYH